MNLPPPLEPPSSKPAGLNGIPVIEQSINLATLSNAELEDKVKQAKNKYSEYFPEGLPPRIQTNKSMILLAKNVTDELFDQRFLPIKARYLRDENLDLYIRKVPGRCHASIHGIVVGDCGIWQRGNSLSSSVDIGDAAASKYGQKKCEPDVGIFAISDGFESLPRCIIEIEVSHRSPREAREHAEIYFANPTVGAVVLLKVWKRRQNGTFAAVCIVWVRPDDDNNDDDYDGVVGTHFGSISAHEFGTAPIDPQARNNLSGQYDDPVMPWPFVPVGANYTQPNPMLPIDGRAEQIVSIPAYPIIVNATTRQGEGLLNVNPPIQNLEMNLSQLVHNAENNLAPYVPAPAAVGVAGVARASGLANEADEDDDEEQKDGADDAEDGDEEGA